MSLCVKIKRKRTEQEWERVIHDFTGMCSEDKDQIFKSLRFTFTRT